jgi:hypothetical protein
MPRKVNGTGKREPMQCRVTPRIRKMMEDACKESGRSLAQEVEFRLEQSFERDLVLPC